MKQRIISALALAMEMRYSQDTADETIAAAVEKMAQELISAKAELSKVKTETATAKAKVLVDNAINLKKITEAEREEYMKDAIANYDLTERMLNKIPAVIQASKTTIPNNNGGETEDRSKWTLKDWMEKDEKGLLEMREKQPSVYAQLYEAHYKRPCPAYK